VPRSGFTLMEMMLVLLLIVVAASLSVPFVDSPLASQSGVGVDRRVRVSWEQTRARAMKRAGRTRLGVEGNTFRIERTTPHEPRKGYEIEGTSEACLFVSNGRGSSNRRHGRPSSIARARVCSQLTRTASIDADT